MYSDDSGEPVDLERFQQVASAGVAIWERWDRRALEEERARRTALDQLWRVSEGETDDLRVRGNALSFATALTIAPAIAPASAIAIPAIAHPAGHSGSVNPVVTPVIANPSAEEVRSEAEKSDNSCDFCIVSHGHASRKRRVRQRRRCDDTAQCRGHCGPSQHDK